MEFSSIYAEDLIRYYELRCSVLSKSAKAHELCYLKRFDCFVNNNIQRRGQINEAFICSWLKTLQGKKSGSIENEVITIRQFLRTLSISGEKVYMPSVPKVHDDYVPYIFSDEELAMIFERADNIVLKKCKKNTELYTPLQFPVALRLMYSSGLRVGETVSLSLTDVDLQNGLLRLLNTKGEVIFDKYVDK